MSLSWGILGTGTIASVLAEAIRRTPQHELAAVASRTQENANQFARDQGAARAYAGYGELLDDDAVDIVYVATPHPAHAQWAVRALDAGKHVLCEKPIGMNHAEAMAITHRAQACGRFLMEAFMYRCHPQTERLKALIDAGTIGEIRHMEASFGYNAPRDDQSRLYANELGGGGILDVGCYPVSLARLVLGEPITVKAHGHLGPTGVDEWTTALMCFDHGVTAQVSTAIGVQMRNTATIFGSEGQIEVANPWLPGRNDEAWSFEITRSGVTEREAGTAPLLYDLEIEAVRQAIADGRIEHPAMNHADTRGNARALDAWRSDLKLSYLQERPPHVRSALPAAPTSAEHITTAVLPGLGKPVSRLVMGCDNQPGMDHAAIMWDHFADLGGNAFDTAHIYGGGLMEQLLGHWHTARGNREELVIIGKGAHTPHNFPEHIGPQLTESLDRLQTDYVDVYFLHRDNTDVPVDEFVSALNDERAAGRIRVFGGSNWTLDRTRQFNSHAQAQGLAGFAAISNNFSLARMVNRIWPGVEAMDDDFLRYIADNDIALLPWSSQARGFFTPWATEVIAQQGDEQRAVTSMEPTVDELKHTWFSAQNLERRERAGELAERLGTSMISVALAYVLHQPFATFPLIGPRVLEEIDSCVAASALPLSAEDVAWLAAPAGK